MRLSPKPGRALFWAALVAVQYLLLAPLFAFDRTNVPLKNWGGFSIQRSWVYDALEKIVLAGLADHVLLNTKPLSRVEAARIVGQAVGRLKADQSGDYNHRGYIEDLLYQLVEEFGPELKEMGVETPLNRDAVSRFFEFKPIDHVQFGADFATRSQRLVNRMGLKVEKSANASPTLDGRLHVGDSLSLYYQPELLWNKDSFQGRFLSAYGKITQWNIEVEGGRDSLWWGPGFRGSMTFSNNAFPLDQVRVGSAEPFRLPWLLKYLGPMKLTAFVAQLHGANPQPDRDFSDAKVGAWRIGLAPFRHVELGFNRVFEFGGKGRGNVNAGQFFKLFVTQGSDDPKSALNVNNLMSLDVTLRLSDLDRYVPLARDMALYVDFGWDDTTSGLIAPDRPGGIGGAYLTGFLGDPKLDLRVEYARTSDIQFTHGIYTSGFTNRKFVLSHHIGTKGDEVYTRVTRQFSPDLLLGTQLSWAEVGPTASGLLGAPREKRTSVGADLSYRFSDGSSVFLGYDFAHVENRGSESGKSGNDHLFRMEFTRLLHLW